MYTHTHTIYSTCICISYTCIKHYNMHKFLVYSKDKIVHSMHSFSVSSLFHSSNLLSLFAYPSHRDIIIIIIVFAPLLLLLISLFLLLTRSSLWFYKCMQQKICAYFFSFNFSLSLAPSPFSHSFGNIDGHAN